MKVWFLIALVGMQAVQAASIPGSPDNAAVWESVGRSRFLTSHYKQAAYAFEKALQYQPANAAIHYWLGKTQARWADIADPISAPRHARKARRSLERAVELEPRNPEYLRELFAFYIDSPEWFDGGLERAALLKERLEAASPNPDLYPPDPVVESRREHSGAGWWMRWIVLRTSGTLGRAAEIH